MTFILLTLLWLLTPVVLYSAFSLYRSVTAPSVTYDGRMYRGKGLK